MGKGVVADSHKSNFSAARSTAMKEADVVLVLGARLNWILSFGLPPKWNADVKIIQIDLSADEVGKNGGDEALILVGDVGLVLEQITSALSGWKWQSESSKFYQNLQAAKSRNEGKAAKKASISKIPITFEHAFGIIKETLTSISNPKDGDIVYVSEGANAMDISRSIFTMEHPRTRLDAGTYATMGVGLGYAIAAYAAYNYDRPEGQAGAAGRKKIVSIEGDSAFGFSGMEVETMARFGMDVLIFIMNNSGLYRGDADESERWQEKRRNTLAGTTTDNKGLSAWSLGYETDYQKIAEMAGGIGILVRTPEELREATIRGFKAKVPVVVNVIIDQQADLKMVSDNHLLKRKAAMLTFRSGLLVARHGAEREGEATIEAVNQIICVHRLCIFTSSPSCTTKKLLCFFICLPGWTSSKWYLLKICGSTLLISKIAKFLPIQTCAPPPNWNIYLSIFLTRISSFSSPSFDSHRSGRYSSASDPKIALSLCSTQALTASSVPPGMKVLSISDPSPGTFL